MSDGTRFVVYLMTAWACACGLVMLMIAALFWVMGWGVFADV